MMPIPPIQCVDARQKSKPMGNASISVKIVAPVVVKPETLSNHAFTKENSPPHKIYGIAPDKQDINQLKTTINRPSLLVIPVAVGVKIRGNPPNTPVITAL